MTQAGEKKDNTRRRRLWAWHILICILLISVSLIMFRFSEKKAFKDVVKSKAYVDSSVFAKQMQKDILNVFSYANLAARFETAGELDLTKVVLSGKDTDGDDVSYTLQDAIDYGESLGAYFDTENRLVLRKNEAVNANNNRLSDSSQIRTDREESRKSLLDETAAESRLGQLDRGLNGNTYAHWNGNFVPAYPDTGERENAVIYRENALLTLLNQLAEYYELKSYLGLEEDDSPEVHNFHFRLIMTYGDRVVLAANDRDLTRTALNSYGRYFAMSSDDKTIASNLPSVYNQEMVSDLRGSRQLKDLSYSLLVAVNTTFDHDDIYRTEVKSYQSLRLILFTGLVLAVLLILALFMSLFALIDQDRQEILEEGEAYRVRSMDRCYAELLLLFLVIDATIVYWSLMEITYALFEHSLMDLLTGLVILIASYVPMVYGLLCVSRRHWLKTYGQTSLLVQLFTNVRDSLDQKSARWRYGRTVRIWFSFNLFGIVLAAAASYLVSRSAKWALACLCLLAFVWLIALRWINGRNRQRRQIFDRIQSMAEGEIGQALDLDAFEGDMKNLAEIVNDLDRGLENAVRERTHEERLKTDLIANVSHDLRTPLTSIITYVELIRREKIDNPRVEEYLNILDQKAMRLKTMAEELMDAGRAASGNLKINWMRIDLVEMIYQVQGEFADRMESRKLICVLNNLEPPAFIAADGKILWRVLDNLYTNVCKYAKPGTVVQVDLKETMGSYVFTMKNISQQTLDMSADELTERFVQGDRSRSAEGSGLGLAIAKSMTQQLHGKFDLFPEGDVFRVRLVFPRLGADEETRKEKE